LLTEWDTRRREQAHGATEVIRLKDEAWQSIRAISQEHVKLVGPANQRDGHFNPIESVIASGREGHCGCLDAADNAYSLSPIVDKRVAWTEIVENRNRRRACGQIY
jgi:hypothetical protein